MSKGSDSSAKGESVKKSKSKSKTVAQLYHNQTKHHSPSKQEQQQNEQQNETDTNQNNHNDNMKKKPQEPPVLSKRQRRQVVNQKHKLPQQPKIQSMAQRHRAYLRVSGLVETSAKTEHQPLVYNNNNQRSGRKMLDPPIHPDDPAMRFGRLLGSPDQRTRHKAVLMLRLWLKAQCAIVTTTTTMTNTHDESESDDTQNQTENEEEKASQPTSASASPNNTPTPSGISEMDLLKLWKALWHTLYMADKVPVQNELARILASLVWALAGTPEEDEFAGQAYLNMYADGRVGFEDEDEESDDDSNNTNSSSDEEDEQESSEEDDEEESSSEEPQGSNSTNSNDDDDDSSTDSSSTSEGDLDDQQELMKRAVAAGSDGEEDSLNEDDGVIQDEDAYNAQEFEDMSDDDDDDDVVIQGIYHPEEDDEDMEDASDGSEDSIDEMEVKHCRGAHLATLFVKTFFMTVRREWGRMDKYRLDKFYTLMRMVMRKVYRYMALRHWNLGIIRLFNDAIYEEILGQKPNGLRYHLIDVALPELVHASLTTGTDFDPDKSSHPEGEVPRPAIPLTEATFIDCLEPFLAMAQTGAGGDDTVHARVLENILERFLTDYSVLREDMIDAVNAAERSEEEDMKRVVSDDEDEGNKGVIPTVLSEVHVGTIAQFIFDLASDQDTKDSYRKALYSLHKLYMRRLKVYPDLDVDLHPDSDEEHMNLQGDDDDDDDESTAESEEEDDGIAVRQVFVDGNGNILDDTEEEAGEEEDAPDSPNESNDEENESDDDDNDSEESEEEKVEKAQKSTKKQQKTKGAATVQKAKNDSPKEKKRRRDSDKSDDSLDKTQHEASAKKMKHRQDESSALNDKKDDTDAQPKTKKRKNKNKKSKDSEGAQEEQEIVISVSDQKSAKEKGKAAAKQSTEKKNKDDEDTPREGKRVKFGAVNRARSHKASMKALRNSRPTTPPANPQLSILSKQPKHSKMNKLTVTKTNRKKAKDYF